MVLALAGTASARRPGLLCPEARRTSGCGETAVAVGTLICRHVSRSGIERGWKLASSAETARKLASTALTGSPVFAYSQLRFSILFVCTFFYMRKTTLAKR